MKRLRKALLGASIFAVAAISAAAIFTSFVVVQETGVVLRLGQIRTVLEPGVHFLRPFGIDQVIQVPARRRFALELGHSSASGESLPTDESEMVTGDGEQLAVQWTVTYGIVDPIEYVSSIRDPARALRAFARAEMGAWVGDRSSEEMIALTREDLSPDRAALESEMKRSLQEQLGRYQGGLEVEAILIHEVGLPLDDGSPFAEDSIRHEPGSRSRIGFGLVPIFALRAWEHAVVTQFGKPVGALVTEAGVHSKLPLVHKVRTFDRRFKVYTGNVGELYSRDRNGVLAKVSALWRITDAGLFYQSLRDEQGAEPRLDDIFRGDAREAVARRDLADLIRSGPRDEIQQELRSRANERGEELGLEVVEVRIKLSPL